MAQTIVDLLRWHVAEMIYQLIYICLAAYGYSVTTAGRPTRLLIWSQKIPPKEGNL